MNAAKTEIYRAILVEIKHRIEAIDLVLDRAVQMRAKIAEEHCYLQLRMICENIAIGCLVLHGDALFASQKLMKAYEADRILKGLAELHDKFYPQPIKHAPKDQPLVHLTEGFLTKDELCSLWSTCGGKLHRGSARAVIKGEQPLALHRVQYWRNRIVTLLDRHIVLSKDEVTLCHFGMNDGQGRVHSSVCLRLDADGNLPNHQPVAT